MFTTKVANEKAKAKPKAGGAKRDKNRISTGSATSAKTASENSAPSDPDIAGQAEAALASLRDATPSMIWKREVTASDIAAKVKTANQSLIAVGQLALGVTCSELGPKLEALKTDLEKEVARVTALKELGDKLRKQGIAARVSTAAFKQDFVHCVKNMDTDTMLDILKFLTNKVHDHSLALMVSFVCMAAPKDPDMLNYYCIFQATAADTSTERRLLHSQREFMNKWFDCLRSAKSASDITKVLDQDMLDTAIFRIHVLRKFPSLRARGCNLFT